MSGAPGAPRTPPLRRGGTSGTDDAGRGPGAPPDGHDAGAALHAIETDLEYFRTKRFEPRVFQLVRRGALSFGALLDAARDAPPAALGDTATGPLATRVRAMQDRLDAYVRGVASLNAPGRTVTLVVDDTRRERGDYDAFFRFAKRSHHGDEAQRATRLAGELAEAHAVLDAVTRALVACGELNAAAVAARREELAALGARNGARIVARAWADAGFKRRLLDTGREALRDMDVPPGRLGRLAVAEDTDEVHHVVVCTLCSCYPHDVLGDPPWWYRSDDYKRRIVADPRAALAGMFGLRIPPGRTVRVHDSTSDLRWMVLPRRPAGTEGWDEDRLAALVTSECLVGAAEPEPPR